MCAGEGEGKDSSFTGVGVVVIGRNEAQRLEACFQSLPAGLKTIVYVDSASTDGSLGIARRAGVDVVEISTPAPISAALARNVGFQRMRQLLPELDKVQFVDGDCRVAAAWFELGAAALDRDPGLAAVWGKTQEVEREQSVYKRICNLEWSQGPIGECWHFPGNVMIRTKALLDVRGYDSAVVASEDHELAVRLRQRGWRIVHLDAPMAFHESGMTRVGQWWKRCVRRGVGYAQVFARHGGPPEFYFAIAVARIWAWGFFFPMLVAALLWTTHGLSLLLLAVYPVRVIVIAVRGTARGTQPIDALVWGVHCVAGSFPYLWGMLKCLTWRMLGRRPRIVEWKN